MTILSDDELNHIQARADAATPGPWDARFDGERQGIFVAQKSVALFDIGHLRPSAPDSDFIAHAREDVPRLLAEVRRLRAELAGQGSRG